MKASEKNKIIKRAATLSDEELKNECCESIFDSLGSIVEDMYDLGYDIADIVEQEKYEDYQCEKSDILISLCEERGIKLW